MSAPRRTPGTLFYGGSASIVLASASPRRRELIQLLGLPVTTTAADIDETPRDGEAASDMAVRLSHQKAESARFASGQWSVVNGRQSALIIVARSFRLTANRWANRAMPTKPDRC